MKQFLQDLKDCGDPEKIRHREHMLRDRGLPTIPEENTPTGAKQECIKAHYVMHVLRSIEGEVIDMTHPDFGRVQNIGLHDIVSPESMNCIKKNRSYMGVRYSRRKWTPGTVRCAHTPLKTTRRSTITSGFISARQCSAEWQIVGTSVRAPRICGSMRWATIWLLPSPLLKPSAAKRSNTGPYPYCIFLPVLVC